MADWKLATIENVSSLLEAVPKQAECYQIHAIQANNKLAVHLLVKIISNMQLEWDDYFSPIQLLGEVVQRLERVPHYLDADKGEKLYRAVAHCAFCIPLLDKVYSLIQIKNENAELSNETD